jgi:DNA-binding NtrC family response regulator
VQARIADRLVTLSEKRLGASRRLMASTSEPLLPRVLDGTFDDRLFYRLNVIHFVLPSERNTDDTLGVRADTDTVPVRTQGRHGVSEQRAVAL